MSDKAIPPTGETGALTRGAAEASEGPWSAYGGVPCDFTATAGQDMICLGTIMHRSNIHKLRGGLGADHATSPPLVPHPPRCLLGRRPRTTFDAAEPERLGVD